jgi:hypothetical protein
MRGVYNAQEEKELASCTNFPVTKNMQMYCSGNLEGAANVRTAGSLMDRLMNNSSGWPPQ